MPSWQAPAAWPAAAVQDTLDRLVARADYQRDLVTTLGERILRLILEAIEWAVRAAADLIGRREAVYVLLGVPFALLLARLALELRAEFTVAEPARARRRPTRSSDPWAEAERLAAAGRHVEAAHALLAALLGRLDGRGEVRLHPSKTAGDYARELRRRRAPSAAAFQRFRNRYDVAVYGGAELGADQYARLLEAARPIAAASREPGGQP